VETKLGRRFPIFNKLVVVLPPTVNPEKYPRKQKKREAKRKFEVDRVAEYWL
jgi:hypothetical protein